MTELLTFLVVPAVLVVVGDVALRRVAGAMVARRLTPHLSEHPTVVVHGWGSGWRVLTGSLRRVTIRARDVPAGDVELAELSVHLRGVALSRDGGGPRAASGHFSARLRPDDLADLVDLPLPAALELVDDGVRVTGPGGLGAEADLRVSGTTILVEPRSRTLRLLSRRLRIDLGELPAGARVERLRVTPSGILATGPLATDGPLF